MSVFVDPLMDWGIKVAPRCFSGKPSCHMYANTLDELHAMAVRIGMDLGWFQNARILPHYDLTTSRRALAVRLGAIEHTRSDMKAFVKARLQIQKGYRVHDYATS